jgi:hypothetical protein
MEEGLTRREAFWNGVLGFLAMAFVMAALLLGIALLWSDGFDTGYKCGKYNINCGGRNG